MEIVKKRFYDLTLDELYAIIRSRIEVFVIDQHIIYQDLDFLDQCSTHLFIKFNGLAISYLRIIDPGIKYPETSIGRVLTLPEFRRQGLSKKLLEIAIEEVRKNKKMPIKIEAQEYLLNFYKSLGFEQLSSPFILEGISHISMILSN